MKRFNKILQLRRHTKLKRFSRSAMSVVLAVCLLISCMTVGLIATDAAKVTGEKVGATIPAGGKIYLDTGSLSDWVGNDFYLSLTTSTADFGSYKPTDDDTWIHMDHVRGNLYSATFSSQTTVNKVSFWNKNLSSYNDIWECNASIEQTYDGTNNKFTFTGTSWNEDRKSNDISGSWSVYDPDDYIFSCPSTVIDGTDIMFYIKGYNGDNVLRNSSKQEQSGATFNTVDNSNGYAYVQAPKIGVGSYQYITNNPSGWAGNQNSDIGTSSAGKLHKADDTTSTTAAKTATTTLSSTSITTGTASISLRTTCNSTTGVYNSLPLYYQYYLDDTYVASSEKAAKTTEQSFTLNTSSLTEGSHTVKTILTDGNIFYIANTETITVSDAVVPSIDTFTIGSSTLNIGETTTISSTKSNSSDSVTYAVTTGADVISLTGTTVKALKPGSATITASLTGATSKTVTVTVRTPTLTVTYDPASIYVGGDSTSAPTVTATNVNADTTISSKSFTKSGSAGTINASTGVVTSSASTTGTVTVTATATVSYNGVSYTSATGTATVTVKNRETVYLRGLTNDYTWDANDANKMTYNSTTGLYEITRNLYSGSTTYNGDNGFKLYVDDTYYGKNSTTLTTSSTSASGLSTSGGNIYLTTKDLSSATSNKVPYKFTYSTDSKTVTVYYPMKVTYNMQSHGTNPSDNGYVVAYNSTITAPTAPTASGYTFGGWYKEAACTNAWNFSTDKVTADTTLYAKWTEIPKYDITVWTVAGGTVTASKTRAEAGEEITLTISTEMGYQFQSVGVQQGSNVIQITDVDSTHKKFTMPAGNTDVTPYFTEITYTGITKSARGSQSANALTDFTDTTYDQTLTAPTVSTSGTYVSGVNITAASVQDYTFYKWVITGGTFTKGENVTESETATKFYPTQDGATVKALYRRNYTVTLTQGSYGTISIDVTGTMKAGDPYVITASPDSGYKLSALTVNGVDVIESVSNQTYNGIASGSSSTITIVATFAEINWTHIRVNKALANNQNDLKNAYIWYSTDGGATGGEAASWPGEMVNNDSDWVEDPIYPDYYTRSFQFNWGDFQIIFNNGGNVQTPNSDPYETGEDYYIDAVEPNQKPVLTAGAPPYTIVGTEGLVGSNWNTNDSSNNMIKSDSTFSLTKSNSVSKSSNDGHGYKVVTSHDYTYGQYPVQGNQYIHVLYNNSTVAFSYSPSASSNKLTATVSGGTYDVTTSATNGNSYISSTDSTVNTTATSVTLNGTNTYTESNYSSSYTTHTVYVKAVPNTHFEVVGWKDGSGNTITPTTVTSNGDTKTATFSVTTDTAIIPNIQRKTHNAYFTTSPTGGTVKVNSKTTSPQTIGEALTYTVTLTPATGYKITVFTIAGTDCLSGYTEAQRKSTINYSRTMGNADETILVTFAKIDYSITGVINPDYGTLKFYSDSDCTHQINTAQIGDTFYSQYTSPNGGAYSLNNYTISGTGASKTNTSGNEGTFTMGSANVTVTANLKATKPTFSGTWSGMNAFVNESFTYSNPDNGTVTPSGCSFTYSFNGGSYQASPTFTAPNTSGTYTLTIKASNKPDGINTEETTTQDVTITVIYHEKAVRYYVDMHNNSMTGKTLEVAVVSNASGTTVMKNSNNQDCKDNLQKQGSSTVYSKEIYTPATKTDSTTYNNIYIRIKFGDITKIININSSDATALMNASAPEVWIEALNETSNTFRLTFATNETPAVASGNKRIYVAKPYSWQSNAEWEHLHLYHWGDYVDIGWDNAPQMTYIGNDGNYHYYYIDVASSINNIIFQGWKDNSTSPDVQTGNIESIGSANFFVLSKDGNDYVGTKGENATVPGYTRYVDGVYMNVSETANITPTHTGAKVTYAYTADTDEEDTITISDTGVVSATGSTKGYITVKVFGSIGAKVTSANPADMMTYTVRIDVRNPGVFKNFKIMSFAHQEYTVTIPTAQNLQPGYFVLNDTSVAVNGLYDGSAYTVSYANSAIITETASTNVTGVGSVSTSFVVKYAASDSTKGYSNISLNNATIITRSIKHEGTKRFGFKQWNPFSVRTGVTSSKVINDGVETVTHNGLAFATGTLTYSAEFEEYAYVDVTFTFNYYEYKPKKVDAEGNVVLDNADGMIQYPYDSTWAGNEESSNANFEYSHTQKTYTVQNYEVRGYTATGADGTTAITSTNLVTDTIQAIGVMPSNNYYDYTIDDSTINIDGTNAGAYTATVTVNMKQNVKQYKVYVNGTQTEDDNSNPLTYTYQQYATPSVDDVSNWYAVDKSTITSTDNAPLLAAGTKNYKFRVKGDTYLRTTTGTALHGDSFNRSEVGFSHYEVTHMNNLDYLLQNFYIADFFSPSEVLDPASNNGLGNLPYDDAQFVGGGVVYYSVTNGTPFANAVSAGYVDGNGTANATAVKEMLKANIEAQYAVDDIAGEVGEEEAMKIAYGTEIAAKKNVEGGFNTGIIYRYLPLNEYKRDVNGNLIADGEGKYTYDVNSNTFRYSNSLQSYQYVYASGNENKATNSGKNMRLYSYYIYSYVAYNQETNVPETKYEVVLSDNYADASTYWAGNPNPNPNS